MRCGEKWVILRMRPPIRTSGFGTSSCHFSPPAEPSGTRHFRIFHDQQKLVFHNQQPYRRNSTFSIMSTRDSTPNDRSFGERGTGDVALPRLHRTGSPPAPVFLEETPALRSFREKKRNANASNRILYEGHPDASKENYKWIPTKILKKHMYAARENSRLYYEKSKFEAHRANAIIQVINKRKETLEDEESD